MWASLIGIQGPPRGPHFLLPLQDCSLPRTSIFPWPCGCAARPWARAAPPRPQPGDTPPAATLGSGCLSAHTVHLGNSVIPRLSRKFPPQSVQFDSRFLGKVPSWVCASPSPIPHANMWLPIHLITLYRKLNVLQLHYLWYRWGLHGIHEGLQSLLVKWSKVSL